MDLNIVEFSLMNYMIKYTKRIQFEFSFWLCDEIKFLIIFKIIIKLININFFQMKQSHDNILDAHNLPFVK